MRSRGHADDRRLQHDAGLGEVDRASTPARKSGTRQGFEGQGEHPAT